jgi:hypothetical protein
MSEILWVLLGVGIGLLLGPLFRTAKTAMADEGMIGKPLPPSGNAKVWHEVVGYKLATVTELPTMGPANIETDHLGFESIPAGDEATKTKTVQARGGEVTLLP